MRGRPALLRALESALVIRESPSISATVSRMVADHTLVRILPGILTLPERRCDLVVRVAAVAALDPNAVITGMAAARLWWWPGEYVGPVEVLTKGTKRFSADGFIFRTGIPDAAWVHERGGVRFTTPAFTAMWLAATDNGTAIDNGLRLRAFRFEHLHAAMMGIRKRSGNERRRQVLHESRDEPWSPPERKAHGLLRLHRVGGWKANHRVVVNGRVYYGDLAFVREKVDVEIEGYASHSSPADVRKDCHRQSALAAAGWVVLRFTPADVDDEEYFLGLIAACRRRRATQLGLSLKGIDRATA